MSPPRPRALVIGVGHEDRGDDAAGLAVVRALEGRLPKSVECVECRGDVAELLDRWDGVPLAIVVDAVRSGARPGRLVRFDSNRPEAIARASLTSTHGFSLGDALALGQQLGRRPGRWVVVGIEAEELGVGRPMSVEVRSSVEAAATAVLRELAQRPEETAHA